MWRIKDVVEIYRETRGMKEEEESQTMRWEDIELGKGGDKET